MFDESKGPYGITGPVWGFIGRKMIKSHKTKTKWLENRSIIMLRRNILPLRRNSACRHEVTIRKMITLPNIQSTILIRSPSTPWWFLFKNAHQFESKSRSILGVFPSTQMTKRRRIMMIAFLALGTPAWRCEPTEWKAQFHHQARGLWDERWGRCKSSLLT